VFYALARLRCVSRLVVSPLLIKPLQLVTLSLLQSISVGVLLLVALCRQQQKIHPVVEGGKHESSQNRANFIFHGFWLHVSTSHVAEAVTEDVMVI
jgi:hypothetical protein